MGAWRYCEHCGSGLPRPELMEAFRGEQECHSCGKMDNNASQDFEWLLQETIEEFTQMKKDLQRVKLVLARLASVDKAQSRASTKEMTMENQRTIGVVSPWIDTKIEVGECPADLAGDVMSSLERDGTHVAGQWVPVTRAFVIVE